MRLLPFIFALASFAFTADLEAKQGLLLPVEPPIPKDNPQSKEKIELGKTLFFDTRLSVNNKIACLSCHNVFTNGADVRQLSVGVSGKQSKRNAPTVFNSGFHAALFWDGRAKNLEEQAKGPLFHKDEMGMANAAALEKRINGIKGYRRLFKAAFGEIKKIKTVHIIKALAAFQRTLVTPNAPFDRYVAGDKKAISQKARRGYDLFESIRCVECHRPPYFGGILPESMPVIIHFPIHYHPIFEEFNLHLDTGRMQHTGKQSDHRMWRPPILRNVARTGPYFHNGAVKDLKQAVKIMGRLQLDIPLSDEDAGLIVEFLKSLNGDLPKVTVPIMPED